MSVVLMYHDIVTANDKSSGFQNESAFQYKVEVSAFEEQVKALQGKDVVFTFDDGGESFITKAAPILAKYGFKGVFFISTKYIGTQGFLTAEQVKELAERGHVVGSHSHTHPHNMAELSDDEVEKEWSESVNALEATLGHVVKHASIPNGYSSPVIIAKAQKAEIGFLYTSTPTDKVAQKNGLTIIGRYVVHDKMSASDVLSIVNSSKTRKKKHMKWLVLETVKKMLGRNYDKVKSMVVKK